MNRIKRNGYQKNTQSYPERIAAAWPDRVRGAEGGGNRCYSFGGRGAADRGAEQSGSAFPQCGNGKGGDRLCSGGRFRRRGEDHCKRLAEK